MQSIHTITLATSNRGKIAEFEALLAPMTCVPQQHFHITEAEECGLSFIENAIIKARHASKLSAQPALADDSGLVVDALNGRPGIYSARFASEHASDQENIEHLLNELNETPAHLRQAYFYCAIAFVKHADDPTPLVATGLLHGVITHKPSGTHGFGYDPVFLLPQYQQTLAELPATEKNKISHRAQALQQLFQLINNINA